MVSDDILERIRRVLAYTESPNEHEAANAATKVEELLFRYNLSINQIEDFAARKEGKIPGVTDQTVDIETKRNQGQWKRDLAVSVANYHFCKALIVREISLIYIVGRELDVTVSTELYHWLIEQIEQAFGSAWKRYKPMSDSGLGERKPTFRRGFYQGAVVAINRQMAHRWVEITKQAPGQSRALVQQTQEVTDEYISSNWGDVPTAKFKGGSSSIDGSFEGYRAGRKIDASPRTESNEES